MLSRQKKAVIIGAGAAGLFAARALKKQGITPILLEKEARVGGKCNTFSDPKSPHLKTELGAAMIAPNYGVVLDAIVEKKITFEESVGTKRNTIEFLSQFDSMSWSEKAIFPAQFGMQLAKFTYAVTQYHHARDNQLPLPADYEIPFKQYAENHGLEQINSLLKPFVTGFGYGAMDVIPAYCVFEYMGTGTIPAFGAEHILHKSSLIGIKGGTQYLMERIAEDFEVITSATVSTINRTDGNVSVTYNVNDVAQTIDADALVLAIPPLHWTKLGMNLTDVEQECVRNLNYYRYPVAACKIKGLEAKHAFIPPALEKEGFGHLALITTRDNRSSPEDGRLCTAYINLPPGQNDFSFEDNDDDNGSKIIRDEINNIHGVKDVEFMQTKIWEDYMPTLPWQQRLKLEREQMREDTSTLYVGAYPVGGFEDIRCVANQATQAVDRYVGANQPDNSLAYANKELRRAHGFFNTIPRALPISDLPANTNNPITFLR